MALEFEIAWWGIAALAALMALDEGIRIHERLERIVAWVLPEHGLGVFAWLFIGIPIVAVLAVALMWVAKVVGQRPRRWLFLGFAFFFSGAVGVEALGVVLSSGDPPVLGQAGYRWLVHLEELLELVGAAFLVCAPLSVLQVSRTEGRIVLTRHPDVSRDHLSAPRARPPTGHPRVVD